LQQAVRGTPVAGRRSRTADRGPPVSFQADLGQNSTNAIIAANNKGADMDLLDISEKRTMSREEAAALLHRLADSLARHNEVEFSRAGKNLHIRVPDQVELECEIEVESDESSIEIEISW
jgi:amphi-Trp domain-containing protein